MVCSNVKIEVYLKTNRRRYYQPSANQPEGYHR